MSDVLYLSRRNLLTLLSKLDRAEAGDETARTLNKFEQHGKRYCQTMPECMVIAIEDDEYYGGQGRSAGEVHAKDGGKYKSEVNNNE